MRSADRTCALTLVPLRIVELRPCLGQLDAELFREHPHRADNLRGIDGSATAVDVTQRAFEILVLECRQWIVHKPSSRTSSGR